MNPPAVEEIVTAIRLLNVNKAAVGADGIPAFYLQAAAIIVAPYRQCFVEFSFTNGIFIENYTLARVILLHKKGDVTNPSNYRPISIHSCLAKILERLITIGLLSFSKNIM